MATATYLNTAAWFLISKMIFCQKATTYWYQYNYIHLEGMVNEESKMDSHKNKTRIDYLFLIVIVSYTWNKNLHYIYTYQFIA